MYWDHVTFLKSPSVLLGFLEKKLLSSSLGEAVRNCQKKECEPRLPLQVCAKCTLSASVPCIQTGTELWNQALFLLLLGICVSPKPGCAKFQWWIFHSHTCMLCCFRNKGFKQGIWHLFGGGHFLRFGVSVPIA